MNAKSLLLCVTVGFIAASCSTADSGSPPVFDRDNNGTISDSNLGADAESSQWTTAPDTSASTPQSDVMVEEATEVEVSSPDTDEDSPEAVASADSAVNRDSDQPSEQDDEVEQDETERIIANLYGSIPTTALGPPSFTAINSDESTRTIMNLIGSPTILWFFPFAGSPG